LVSRIAEGRERRREQSGSSWHYSKNYLGT
jgi:hypothetical protein